MVKTVEQANSLPEISSADLFCDSNVPLLIGGGIEGDDIILFVDGDGRTMTIVETKNGPAKMPFEL